MKCMNCMGCQVILLLGLAFVGGGVANLARSDDPEKFLPWSTDLYAAPTPAREKPQAPAPEPESPARENPADEGTPDTDPDQVVDVAPEPVGTTPDPVPPDDGATGETDDDETDGDGEFRRIGFEAALEEFEMGTFFVDARRTKDYVEGHITGAVSISPYEQSVLAEKIARVAQEVPEEAPVIVYCTASEDCEDSAMISRQLQNVGLRNISIYKGGFPEWDAKLRGDERRSRLITTGAEPGEREL